MSEFSILSFEMLKPEICDVANFHQKRICEQRHEKHNKNCSNYPDPTPRGTERIQNPKKNRLSGRKKNEN
jgi:hypothetical protein